MGLNDLIIGTGGRGPSLETHLQRTLFPPPPPPLPPLIGTGGRGLTNAAHLVHQNGCRVCG